MLITEPGGYRHGKHEKRVYLEAIRKRYRRVKRTDKGKILDEFSSVCGYQRKYDERCNVEGSDVTIDAREKQVLSFDCRGRGGAGQTNV